MTRTTPQITIRKPEERLWKAEEGEYPYHRGGGWHVHAKEVWRGRRGLEVHFDEVTKPNGNYGEYEYAKIKSGVGILPLDDDRTVYLAQGFQYGVGKDILEVAGGGIEIGEKPEIAAAREVEEELGIKAKRLVPIGECNPITGIIDTHQYLFLATDFSVGQTEQEDNEKILPVRMPLEEALILVRRGKIEEAQTRVLILTAKDYLENPGEYRAIKI